MSTTACASVQFEPQQSEDPLAEQTSAARGATSRPRTKTLGKRHQRKLNASYLELLQELRVAITGLQVLLAFLLTLAFSPRFHMLASLERHLYVATIVVGTAAAALLMAPAAAHRTVSGCGHKQQQFMAMASTLALVGLTLMPLAVGGALTLALCIVIGTNPALIAGTGILTWFALFWFVLPAWLRLRRPR